MYSQTDGINVVNYTSRPRGNLYVLGGMDRHTDFPCDIERDLDRFAPQPDI
jgi:hypothetical protein